MMSSAGLWCLRCKLPYLHLLFCRTAHVPDYTLATWPHASHASHCIYTQTTDDSMRCRESLFMSRTWPRGSASPAADGVCNRLCQVVAAGCGQAGHADAPVLRQVHVPLAGQDFHLRYEHPAFDNVLLCRHMPAHCAAVETYPMNSMDGMSRQHGTCLGVSPVYENMPICFST